ncbi:MAG: restriction endonuclease subunit S [Bifidobacterium bifidum]
MGYQSTRKNVIVSSLYEVFKTDHSCDDRFLWHWFKSSLFTKQIEMLQEGGVRLYFFFDKLQKSEIWMPNVDEQRIIGQQFDQLDSLITLHQRKYDKLVVFKKSMLEKMFPKDGESVPEIRFAGFTDPWEQRKLGTMLLSQPPKMLTADLDKEDALSVSGVVSGIVISNCIPGTFICWIICSELRNCQYWRHRVHEITVEFESVRNYQSKQRNSGHRLNSTMRFIARRIMFIPTSFKCIY